MKKEIKIPAIGESVHEVTVGRFLKPSGSTVSESEEIVEIETEKVNQVLFAPISGTLQWSVEEGATATIDQVIGYVEEGVAQAPKPKEVKQETQSQPLAEEKPVPKEAPPPSGVQEKQKETPLPPSGAREKRKKMSRIRQVIAGKLVESLHSAAMLTTFNEVDMSAILELRARYKESFLEKHKVKLGLMSFFVKAVVEGLKAYPQLNSYIDKDEVVERCYYDIGIAVGAERGLVVPVVRKCDTLTFAQVEQEIAAYATKARAGKLRLDELEGGGFTITNGGVYGSLLSTPILNPPQVGILGMHKIEKRAMVLDDTLVIRPMMYLALSYDHRLIDGKEAILFLVKVKEILEDPSRLLFLEEEHKAPDSA